MSEEIVAPGVTCQVIRGDDGDWEAVYIKVYVSHPSDPTREIYLYPDDLDAVCSWWTAKRVEQPGGRGQA